MTSAASEEIAPALFRRIMGFESGLEKMRFCQGASYIGHQQTLSRALGGPHAGEFMNPMAGTPPKLYLDLAYRTSRDERMWVLSQHMSKVYGKLGMTAVEIEAQLEAGAEQAVHEMVARIRGVKR